VESSAVALILYFGKPYLEAKDHHSQMTFRWHLKSSIGQYKRLELFCQSYSLQAKHQQHQQLA